MQRPFSFLVALILTLNGEIFAQKNIVEKKSELSAFFTKPVQNGSSFTSRF
jgi:hypothetical protein